MTALPSRDKARRGARLRRMPKLALHSDPVINELLERIADGSPAIRFPRLSFEAAQNLGQDISEWVRRNFEPKGAADALRADLEREGIVGRNSAGRLVRSKA